MSKLTEQIERIIAPVAEEMGIYLVDVEQGRMNGGTVVTVYIDTEEGIDIDTCENFHRAIVDPLEPVDYDYLQVSSPGDRPLKKDQDYTRMTGREVEVSLYAARKGGKKKFVGVLLGKEDEIVKIDANGEEIEFNLKEVSAVRPYFRMD